MEEVGGVDELPCEHQVGGVDELPCEHQVGGIDELPCEHQVGRDKLVMESWMMKSNCNLTCQCQVY